MITLGHHGLMMRQGATPPVYPPGTPPGNWIPLMEQSRWTVTGPFSDPCSATDWQIVQPWEQYPGNLGGMEKAGVIGSSSCRFGFWLRPVGSFLDTFHPSKILIGVRRNPTGSVGASASFSAGGDHRNFAVPVLSTDDYALVITNT